LAGDVLKGPVAEVAIKGVVAGETAEENVWATVAIVVATGDTAAVLEDAVRGGGPIVESVGEGDASLYGGGVG
jgi:hypothetical protein